MSLKFGQIRSGTTELAALPSKKSMLPLFLVSQLWLYLGNSQVSIYRTKFGPLVLFCLLLCVCSLPTLILQFELLPNIL